MAYVFSKQKYGEGWIFLKKWSGLSLYRVMDCVIEMV